MDGEVDNVPRRTIKPSNIFASMPVAMYYAPPMKKLTDREAHDRLMQAQDALGVEECESIPAQTAIEAARKVLIQIQMALLLVIDRRPPDEPR
jgi:hypothetical protein